MSRTLLRELCSRWLERRGGIQFRYAFIPFTKLDVCLGLEVRVDEERFELFKEDVDSHTRRLFDRTDVCLGNVYEELEKRLKGTKVVTTEVFISNEDMCNDIVKESFDGHDNGNVKKNN
ncbi:uncharacterized protein HKW66_Vig0227840 [Vigna angularis]|uniref:Uncharacterized protein n=1 Tax=Phaseolus angularis TaxID=3914 RepID=A0A8T0KB75_PHAAN|nr:uncharacterized protein HKW66_Vig0227840 [Vigna angularis]